MNLRLSYIEASLLVVGANMAMGLARRPSASDEDRAMAAVAPDIVGNLYQAEPALKQDAGRIEGEMRSLFAELPDDDTEAEDEASNDAGLQGQGWLGVVADAIAGNQELALQSGDGDSRERFLQPLGAGQIGNVAVAIGWSADTSDFAAVRLDNVGAVRRTGANFDDDDGGLYEACLDRFDRQPRRGAD